MNKQLFNLYKESERGKNFISLIEWKLQEDFFRLQWLTEAIDKECGCDFSCGMAEDVYYSMDEMHAFYHESGKPQEIPDFLTGIWNGEICTREDFSIFIENLELKQWDYEESGTSLIRKGNFREKAAMMPYLSVWLFYGERDREYEYGRGLFKPMLLPYRHDQFQRNCAAIGIELPPLPSHTDHKGCCMHYYDICTALYYFQKKYGLTDAETCAAIYDFALLMQEDRSEPSAMPNPTNVWLTGASDGDYELLENLGNGNEHGNPDQIWACNERTRRGDIVAIYAVAPHSHIHSIWRADTSGVFNPFDYYHCRTHVSDGAKIPPITFKDLKADPYFSNIPIVRKNLQGVNGWELTAKDYSELLRMIGERGGDTSTLPRLFDGSAIDFGTLDNEYDVEEKILIPTLRKLGYSEADWTRQLSLKAGRKEKAIPDFVFFPSGERHFENAPMVIEAKFDMGSMTEFRNAYRQALSYARMLRSAIFGVCDKERLALYRMSQSGTSDIDRPIYENHWVAIFADDIEGAKLKQLIGREVVSKYSDQ